MCKTSSQKMVRSRLKKYHSTQLERSSGRQIRTSSLRSSSARSTSIAALESWNQTTECAQSFLTRLGCVISLTRLSSTQMSNLAKRNSMIFTTIVLTLANVKGRSRKFCLNKRTQEFILVKCLSCFVVTSASSKISTSMKESKMARIADTTKVATLSSMEVKKSSWHKNAWATIKSMCLRKSHLQNFRG